MSNLEHQLKVDKPSQSIASEISESLSAATEHGLFSQKGLCSGYPLEALPDRYFLAQAFTPDREDLLRALDLALTELGMKPITGDEIYWQGHILCKISALIQGTPFSIFQLTTDQNRNVYLELGIGIALRRPFVLVKDRDAELPLLVQGLDYVPISSYIEIHHELQDKVGSFLSVTDRLPVLTKSRRKIRNGAIIAHGDIDVLDFCIPVARILSAAQMIPIIVGESSGKVEHYLGKEGIQVEVIGRTGNILLHDIIEAINRSSVGIFRVDKSCLPSSFLTLGIAIGLNIPYLPVHRKGSDLPSDIKGLAALNFDSYSELDDSLPNALHNLLDRLGSI